MQVRFIEIGYHNPTKIEITYNNNEKIVYMVRQKTISYIVNQLQRIIANTASFDYTRVKYIASKRLLNAMKQKPPTEGTKSVYELLYEQGIEIKN